MRARIVDGRLSAMLCQSLNSATPLRVQTGRAAGVGSCGSRELLAAAMERQYRQGAQVVVADAATVEDLEAIAQAALELRRRAHASPTASRRRTSGCCRLN